MLRIDKDATRGLLGLASTMSKGSTVKLPRGEIKSKTDLLLDVIHLKCNRARALTMLADAMWPWDKVRFLDGTVHTRSAVRKLADSLKDT